MFDHENKISSNVFHSKFAKVLMHFLYFLPNTKTCLHQQRTVWNCVAVCSAAQFAQVAMLNGLNTIDNRNENPHRMENYLPTKESIVWIAVRALMGGKWWVLNGKTLRINKDESETSDAVYFRKCFTFLFALTAYAWKCILLPTSLPFLSFF